MATKVLAQGLVAKGFERIRFVVQCSIMWSMLEFEGKRGSIPVVVELQAATIRRGDVPTVATFIYCMLGI